MLPTDRIPRPFFSALGAGPLMIVALGCGGPDPSASRVPSTALEVSSVSSVVALPEEAPPVIAVSVVTPPAPAPAPEVPDAGLLTTCVEDRSIVIHKAARTLELRCGDALAARFQASLGNSPEGHKQREGDGKTPEGEYFISMKFPSQFHMSLQIAYPNVADADAGLADKTIDATQHAAIKRAYASCREPPQTTQLGSLLQIHGGGGGPDVGDWTLGCVAVDNAEIEVVFAFQKPGCDASGKPNTRVLITP